VVGILFLELINDTILHEIGDWKFNNIDQLIDEESEESYVTRAIMNIEMYKKKCDSAQMLFNEK